jgi:hypothetical protein
MKNAQGNGNGAAVAGSLRKPVLMLRLNEDERERLDVLVKDSGWTGDLSTFARELILSKRRRKSKAARAGFSLIKLDEVLSMLSVLMKDFKRHLPEDKQLRLRATQLMLSEVAKELYSEQ